MCELLTAPASLVVTPAVVILLIIQAIDGVGEPLSVAVLAGLMAGSASAALSPWSLRRRVVGCSRRQAWWATVCRPALYDTRLAAGLAG